MFPNRVHMDRESASTEPLVYLFIYSHMSPEVTKKGALLHMGKNIKSPSTEPHANVRPTYNRGWPGSARGSLMTLQSLPQCHAALSTIPSTLVCVDQSPIGQHVSQQHPSGYILHNCYHLPHDPGQSRERIYNTPRQSRGVGFMGGLMA